MLYTACVRDVSKSVVGAVRAEKGFAFPRRAECRLRSSGGRRVVSACRRQSSHILVLYAQLRVHASFMARILSEARVSARFVGDV